jgi:hypothetical protein
MPRQTTRVPFFSTTYKSWAIPLTKDVHALVDEDQTPMLGQWNWCATRSGIQWRAMRFPVSGAIKMHRLIMGDPPGMDVDHRKHYPLDELLIDNRRDNLRICTRLQNLCNRRPSKNSRSRFKGVSLYARKGKWQAAISGTHLGYFDDEQDAAMAYDAAARILHGDFAATNESLGLFGEGTS